jgi:thiamine-phosphate pyrophosphorylase
MTPRERLADVRLYLVCDAEPGGRALEPFLRACLRGGVDMIQLRDKDASEPEVLAAASTFRTLADEHGALFILNDRPDLVDAASADGVHLGQNDEAPAAARAVIGPDRVIGRSSHAPAQADAAEADPDVDYLAVGPVHMTPTKPGRPAAGPDYVAYAAGHVRKPWFAIGGLDAATLPAVVALGARRIVVVRALTGAAEPEAAARALREQLEVPVGSARP